MEAPASDVGSARNLVRSDRLCHDAIRTSHTVAISNPPPTHTPWMRATIRCGQCQSLSVSRSTKSAYSSASLLSARLASNPLISLPAEKASPQAPSRTTQRTFSSPASSSKIPPSRAVHGQSERVTLLFHAHILISMRGTAACGRQLMR